MSLRIQTNVSALSTHRYLTDTTKALGKHSERLSSGFRINRAADDAAGLAIANKFKSDIRGMQVASRNTAEATSLVQIAEGAVSSIESILTRMKDLAVQAASANATSQQSVLNTEYQSLIAEIDRIVQSTQYQGTGLINGSFAGQVFQVGTTSAAYDRLSITFGASDSATLTVAGTSLDTAAMGDPSAAMNAIDAAQVIVRSQLGQFGAYQNRLEYAAGNLSTTILNYQTSESVIRDADMAYEMVNFTKFQVLQQAGTAMLAQANAAPQGILSLLR